MSRVSLADLAERSAADPATTAPPAPETPTEPTPPAKTARAPKSSTTRPKRRPAEAATPAPSDAGQWQRFDAYERKEARLRSDQYGQLSDVARRLMRERGKGGERITENTLIRVAIDLLLSRSDNLAGPTEAELRRSLGL